MSWYAPLRWLRLAAQDWRAHPAPCVFYGICFAAMGGVLSALLRSAPVLMLALTAGFLLVGPFLAMGLYEVARCRELGQPCSIRRSALAWRGQRADLAILGIGLGVILAIWARASMVVLAVTMPRSMANTQALLIALAQGQHLDMLLAWLAVGALFAVLVFALTVVAIPMMLDRSTDAITAMLTSVRAVIRYPVAMTIWAALIVSLTALGFLTGLAGLIITVPWIGLASWHAYREIVPAELTNENAQQPLTSNNT